jgi:transglutaminase-like putative cysteine protease
VTLTIKGAAMSAWLDADGTVLQESGLLGMSLKRVSRESALERGTLGAGKDLTRQVSVAAGRIIEAPDRLRRLRVRIEGAGPSLFLDGGRQKFDRGVLTVERESVPDPDDIDVSGVRQYLQPTALMEVDDPAIKEAAASIVKPGERMRDKARRLVSWVYGHIEKRPVISVPSALQTLIHREGDCNEHAVLLAALARASGIPARVEAGLVYVRGRFYYHAWDVLYLGRWVTADALMNQMPADVTHLRLVRGDLSRQMDILGAIGKIRLRVLETDKEAARP